MKLFAQFIFQPAQAIKALISYRGRGFHFNADTPFSAIFENEIHFDSGLAAEVKNARSNATPGYLLVQL